MHIECVINMILSQHADLKLQGALCRGNGFFKLVGIVEMDDDVIMYLDMKSMCFRTRGGFRKRKSPEGKEYFEVRGTDGFKYVVDMCLFGQLEVSAPGHNAIMYGISY